MWKERAGSCNYIIPQRDVFFLSKFDEASNLLLRETQIFLPHHPQPPLCVLIFLDDKFLHYFYKRELNRVDDITKVVFFILKFDETSKHGREKTHLHIYAACVLIIYRMAIFLEINFLDPTMHVVAT